MSKTYKAVFECPALQEREVWYVSSRLEAKRIARQHITRVGGKLLKKYKGVDYSVTISEVFKNTCEVYYDVVSSWGRD
jgi:hypothetical protein